MLGLLFKILGDSSGFRKEMDRTKRDAGQSGHSVGKAFGEQFKSAMMRFIGAGAIISIVKKQLEDALEIEKGAIQLKISPEAFQELKVAADYLGMQIEDLQKLAPNALQEFEELMSKIRASGGIIDSTAVETMAQAAEDLNVLWGKLAPGVGAIVNSVSWFIEKGTSIAEQFLAGIMTMKGLATDDKELENEGRAWYAEAKKPVRFGRGSSRGEIRSSVERFRSKAAANRQLAIENEMQRTAALSTIENAPFIGGALAEVAKRIAEQTAKTEQVRATIEKRL